MTRIDPSTLAPEVRAVLEAANRWEESPQRDCYGCQAHRIGDAVRALRAACRPTREERALNWLSHALAVTHEGPGHRWEARMAERLLAGPLRPATAEELAPVLRAAAGGVEFDQLAESAARELTERYLVVRLPGPEGR